MRSRAAKGSSRCWRTSAAGAPSSYVIDGQVARRRRAAPRRRCSPHPGHPDTGAEPRHTRPGGITPTSASRWGSPGTPTGLLLHRAVSTALPCALRSTTRLGADAWCARSRTLSDGKLVEDVAHELEDLTGIELAARRALRSEVRYGRRGNPCRPRRRRAFWPRERRSPRPSRGIQHPSRVVHPVGRGHHVDELDRDVGRPSGRPWP